MDTITQAVLGAAAGEAALVKKYQVNLQTY